MSGGTVKIIPESSYTAGLTCDFCAVARKEAFLELSASHYHVVFCATCVTQIYGILPAPLTYKRGT